jgi:hypothetical protein
MEALLIAGALVVLAFAAGILRRSLSSHRD